MDRNFKAPLAVNYVAGVEHELPGHYVVGATYSGSQGYNQLIGTDQNRFSGSLIKNNGTLVRLNPNYGSINYITNSNQSTYNALILTFRGAPTAHAHFQGSYMFSHAQNYPEAGTRFDQDIGLGVPQPTSYFNYKGDANWGVRHRFSFSDSYVLPGLPQGVGKVVTSGWQLTTIAALQSGNPFWVYTTAAYGSGGDFNADGNNWDVPNTPANNSKFIGSHSRSSYVNGLFSAADFPVPEAGTEGNLPRNGYRNPGMIQFDASLLKNNPIGWIGDKGNLQFRFDFLNVLNHVNLGAVDANMADSTFGKVTSALASRQLQLGLRVAF